MFACAFSSGCTGALKEAPVSQLAAPPRSLRTLADEYVTGYRRFFPDQAEYDGLTLTHHDRLPDNSRSALESWHALEDDWTKQLDRVDSTRLWGTPEWDLYGYLRHALDASIASRPCREELWPAHQYGWQSTLLILLDQQPIGSAQSRIEAFARWRQLPGFLQTEVGNLREGARLGYTSPRRNVELAIEQITGLLATKPGESPLWSPANRDTDPQFKAEWHKLVENDLLPAIRHYLDFLKDEYSPQARTTIGISGIPNGAACYRGKLKTHTTTDVEPAAVYQLGQDQVADREAKSLNLARKLLSKEVPTLRAAHALLEDDPRNHFASSAEVQRFVEDALARARAAAPRWFERVPRAPLSLVPYADFEAKTHPDARYQPAAQDGSRSAQYRIDVTNFGELRREGVQLTAFHEGIPGHHLQVGLEREMQRGERPIGFMSAFLEGWARYGEGLADEMGLYSSDLDRLAAVSHLPTGLVVDPGLHVMGWSRDQAIAYALEKQMGFTPEAAAAYVDRIAVSPGQMVSYGFGELEIVELRRRAQAELGARFDIRAFHSCVLEHGTITLAMLKEAVGRWIEETKRAR